jgi:hypothetical protein
MEGTMKMHLRLEKGFQQKACLLALKIALGFYVTMKATLRIAGVNKIDFNGIKFHRSFFKLHSALEINYSVCSHCAF